MPIWSLSRWLERRRAIRSLWREDARALIRRDEPNAYYAAQHLAARARARGGKSSSVHWAKVARASSNAEMELAVVNSIVDEELGPGLKGRGRRHRYSLRP